MNVAIPIRKQEKLTELKNYYGTVEYNPRNQLLITMGLNTALRISDILQLKWADVYDDMHEKYLEHIILFEQKTGKCSKIYINRNILSILEEYRLYLKKNEKYDRNAYLFQGRDRAPISRIQAYRIIKKAATACDIRGTISPHSLRKTFGYYAWQEGIEPVLLMNIYNHSSFDITKRYLGIEQDDRDEVFKRICI